VEDTGVEVLPDVVVHGVQQRRSVAGAEERERGLGGEVVRVVQVHDVGTEAPGRLSGHGCEPAEQALVDGLEWEAVACPDEMGDGELRVPLDRDRPEALARRAASDEAMHAVAAHGKLPRDVPQVGLHAAEDGWERVSDEEHVQAADSSSPEEEQPLRRAGRALARRG
jgi:hypothetical protein